MRSALHSSIRASAAIIRARSRSCGLGQPGALDPPVQRGAPAQQAIGALDHIAPVLAAHIAPAAEEAGRHAVGRAGG